MAIRPHEPSPVPAVRDWRADVRALLSWRRIVHRTRAVLRSALVTFTVLTATLWLMPGVASADIVDTLGLVLLVAGVGAVLRPLLLVGIVALGGWGAMLLGVLAQIVVIVVALELDPANRISGLPALVIAAIVAVVFAAILDWMVDSGTDDTFVKEAKRLMRGVRRRQARQAGGPILTLRRPRPGTDPGLLMVQLDGLSEPVLRWAVRAGNLPTLGHWLRAGSHTMRGWHTGLPSTTPASQAGILHGATRQVPGFRWYEKDTGKLMVTNRPRDAAVIEPRLSDGRGLLARRRGEHRQRVQRRRRGQPAHGQPRGAARPVGARLGGVHGFPVRLHPRDRAGRRRGASPSCTRPASSAAATCCPGSAAPARSWRCARRRCCCAT